MCVCVCVCVRVSSQDYKTWLAWAVLERRRGQLQVAEQLFRRGIAVAPRNPHLW